MTLLDEIAKTTIKLLLKEPFYAYFLSALSREVTETKTNTLCFNYLESGLLLQINPFFWGQQSSEVLCGLLQHQILHLLFRHPLKAKYSENAFHYIVAADLLVNQYLSTEHLPDDALEIENFPDGQLAEGVASFCRKQRQNPNKKHHPPPLQTLRYYPRHFGAKQTKDTRCGGYFGQHSWQRT